jgi:hypothetical protein
MYTDIERKYLSVWKYRYVTQLIVRKFSVSCRFVDPNRYLSPNDPDPDPTYGTLADRNY